MTTARLLVLGAARPRSPWFASVAQWSHAAAVPIDFVKCLGPDDLRAHLQSSAIVSAALVDGGLPGIDRNLIADAHQSGAAVIVVADPRAPIDWESLGADAVLPEAFDADTLVATCARVARCAPHRGEAPSATAFEPNRERSEDDARVGGRLIAVIGGGGAGTSTIAIAVAQGLATTSRARPEGRSVVLVDLCRHAELGMLHDADVVSPALHELLELQRTAAGGPDDVRSMCFTVPERGYAILLGLRRPSLWSTVRPSTTTSALGSLRSAFDVVIADVDDDLEGEDVGGSSDVEERNLLARTSAQAADLVMAVGDASLKGVHTLVRVIRDLRSIGVPPPRIQPVLNRAPDGRRARAELASAITHLTTDPADRSPIRPPVFVPACDVEHAHRSVGPLPDALVAPVTAAAETVRRHERARRVAEEPRRIVPGSLGTRLLRDDHLGRGEGMSA